MQIHKYMQRHRTREVHCVPWDQSSSFGLGIFDFHGDVNGAGAVGQTGRQRVVRRGDDVSTGIVRVLLRVAHAVEEVDEQACSTPAFVACPPPPPRPSLPTAIHTASRAHVIGDKYTMSMVLMNTLTNGSNGTNGT